MSSTSNSSHPITAKLQAYAEVMRPANIVTAFADILAGFAVADGVVALQSGSVTYSPEGLGWLLLSTFGLYGGGVVFNDFFDADLDAEERPERPIPSGRISKLNVGVLGTLLLVLGILAAFQVNTYSLVLAILITIGALVYDRWAKRSSLWGPLTMGLCRGGNLLLGCSIAPITLLYDWYLLFIPVAYIASITLISQDEVHGGTQKSGFFALGTVTLVTGGLLLLGYNQFYDLMVALPFIIVFAAAVMPPFLKAAFNPNPEFIKRAVKRGVLSLVLLNSALAAGYGGFILGIIVIVLLPVSILLAKMFAVT